MPQESDPANHHPIREESLKAAYNSQVGDGYDDWRDYYHELLRDIQHHLVRNCLNGWLSTTHGPVNDNPHIERFYQDENAWGFALYGPDRPTAKIFHELGIDDRLDKQVILAAHRIELDRLDADREGPAYREVGEQFDDSSWTGFIIAKDPVWRKGEQHAESELTWLVSHGCSPTEAYDYWMIELRGRDPIELVASDGRDEEVIRENVDKARETIERRQRGETPPVPDLETVYKVTEGELAKPDMTTDQSDEE